ncbi:hypothetical protein [Candidatus Hecatella orcuttiae]|uniref:hypothetical protein n=1 Tax=Candidatus Hecatella orcuttiae TaxID=1935119 RepID=UPI002867DF56|nr:hypothetical protein [Candidatus Hecatella orcuttiae]
MSGKPAPKSPVGLLLLLLIAFLAVFFLFSGIAQYMEVGPRESTGSLLLGLLGILFLVLMVSRILGQMSLPPPKVTLTLLQCSQCAFKSLRNFQLGDFIPKPMGSCPSCGGTMMVEAIYPEEEKRPKRREPKF